MEVDGGGVRQPKRKAADAASAEILRLAHETPALDRDTSSSSSTCHYCKRGAGCDNYLMPHVMQCGRHKFCEKCLRRHFNRKEGGGECPVCNAYCHCHRCLGRDYKENYDTGPFRGESKVDALRYKVSLLKGPVVEILMEEARLVASFRQQQPCEIDTAESAIRVIRAIEIVRPPDNFERATCERCKASIHNLFVCCPSCDSDIELCLKCAIERRKAQNDTYSDEFIKCEEEAQAREGEDSHRGKGAQRCQSHRFVIGRILTDDFLSQLSSAVAQPTAFSARVRCLNDDSIPSEHVQEMDASCIEASPEQALQQFRRNWGAGNPIVIRNTKMKINWSPETLMRSMRFGNSGNESVTVVSSENWHTNYVMSLPDFFAGYNSVQRRVIKGELLRLKDWPDTGDFRKRLPRLFSDICYSLPFRNYCFPSLTIELEEEELANPAKLRKYDQADIEGKDLAPLNLCHDLPIRNNRADIGPKMYTAYGRRNQGEVRESNFTTRMHVDMADAINLMVHEMDGPHDNSLGNDDEKKGTEKEEEPSKNFVREEGDEVHNHFEEEKGIGGGDVSNNGVKKGTEMDKANEEMVLGGARWDMWKQKDRVRLTEWLQDNLDILLPQDALRKTGNFADYKCGDPIHDQLIYLSQEHIGKLKEDTGIDTYTIIQNRYDAIYIPAGCPHQVRNLTSCFKVAFDFVSPENIQQTVNIADEFSALKIQDKLQVKSMVLHAFVSASQVLDDLGGREVIRLEGLQSRQCFSSEM